MVVGLSRIFNAKGIPTKGIGKSLQGGQFVSVRLRLLHGTVRAVPVFGSDGPSGERVSQYLKRVLTERHSSSSVAVPEKRFRWLRFLVRFLEKRFRRFWFGSWAILLLKFKREDKFILEPLKRHFWHHVMWSFLALSPESRDATATCDAIRIAHPQIASDAKTPFAWSEITGKCHEKHCENPAVLACDAKNRHVF